ncbi:MAG: nicotinate phosphoribosyltransferase [Halochromatium sp.]|uniref:nicotinate phosphoribosyltransferase n=1 Tax=Halochromatium sp. TaxID=2049430 RepID=UPI00397957C8
MIPANALLLTDLYELAMLEAYHANRMENEAVFDFFVRELPPGYGFLVAAGLEQVLATLQSAQFSDEELAWVADSGHFGDAFLDYLRAFRFTGSVHAMREGTVFFPDEPILRVTAPLPQAQLLETRIINLLQYQTLIATKAARCVAAAPDKQLVDFGLRRAHGAEAGLMAARASWLGGFAGSATVLAAARFGVPIFGTMAHSFIEAHDDEMLAFEHFARARPDHLVFLIDTYDTEGSARRLIGLAQRLAEDGIRVQGVRLDSGDLAEHARQVRAILDEGGLDEVHIFASGGLDEHRIAALLAGGAPIDGFGIGSRLDTSANAPYLDCAYKLTEYAGQPRRKHSEHKATWPGRKQVVRRYDAAGRMAGDRIQRHDEPADGESLLEPVMDYGELKQPAPTLAESRDHCALQLSRLPPALRALDAAPDYPVEISDRIQALAREADVRITQQQLAGHGKG